MQVQELYERHHLRIFRFFRRMSGSISVAEDLTQELFVHVLRREVPDEGQRSENWLFAIARNLLRDRWRRGQRRPDPDRLSNDAPIPMEPVQQLVVELDQALLAQNDEDREIFLLREIGGCGYEEIAEITGRSPDAVRSRIHRTRLALRAALHPPIERVRKQRARGVT